MQSTSESVVLAEKKYLAKAQKIPYYPLVVEKGRGALVYDAEGREYIDMLSSASSANIGHGNAAIADAVCEQMKRIAQYTIGYFHCKEPVMLAQRLVELWPGGGFEKVLFTNSGSAANDGAIKLARAFTKRKKLISFILGYYGSSYGAISLSAISPNMRRDIGPMLPDVYHFAYPDCRRCKFGKCEASCALECLGEIEGAFSSYLPPQEVAAVFFEPIQGDGGIIVPPVRYVRALSALCTKHGILLVADEIQQGLGRTGKWFCMEHFGVAPDMTTLGKSLGAGLPMGAIMGRAEIMDSLEPPAHIFTLSGNSAVCAASMKMLDIMEEESILEKTRVLGEEAKARLSAWREKYEIVGDVRGMGLSLGVELVLDKRGMEKNRDAAVKIAYQCIKNGLVIIFFSKSVIRIQPPLVITGDQLNRAFDIIENAIVDYIAGKIGDEAYEKVQGW